ncbi:MAG: hypothetical protein C4326_09370 [Ignavibacteria bacterium]
MKSGKFWLAVLVGGVVANIIDGLVWDGLVWNLWLGPSYVMQNTTLFRQDTAVAWYIIGDFVATFVFVWVYDKVAGAFGTTVQDGAKAGLYLGILMSFPTFIFMSLMFNGFSYGLSWIMTIYSIIWYVILGTVVAAVMKKGAATAAA